MFSRMGRASDSSTGWSRRISLKRISSTGSSRRPIEGHGQIVGIRLRQLVDGRCRALRPARRTAPGRRPGRRGRRRSNRRLPCSSPAASSSASRNRSGQLREISTRRCSRSARSRLGGNAVGVRSDKQEPRQRRIRQLRLELAFRGAARACSRICCMRSRKAGVVAVAGHVDEAGRRSGRTGRRAGTGAAAGDPADAGCRRRCRTARPRMSAAARRADRSPEYGPAPCPHGRSAEIRRARRRARPCGRSSGISCGLRAVGGRGEQAEEAVLADHLAVGARSA